MIEAFEGKSPTLGRENFIHESASIIGHVSLGDHVSIWPMTVLRGDVNSITIGDESNIQDLSMLHVSHDGPVLPGGASLIIGKRVTVGHKAMLHGCQIEDEVLVGMNVIIMDRAIIESHVIIGAGSLIPMNKKITTGLWLGSPAKKVRNLTEAEIESIRYSSEHYCRLKTKYLNRA